MSYIGAKGFLEISALSELMPNMYNAYMITKITLPSPRHNAGFKYNACMKNNIIIAVVVCVICFGVAVL